MMRASELGNAGDQVLTSLSQARQTAISRNRIVEVRLYKYSDPSKDQEPADGRFRSMQLFPIDPLGPSGTPAPLGGMLHFAGSTYIASNAQLSSLVDPVARPTVTGAALGQPIPPYGLAYQAATFRFYPDGSTDLPIDRPWFLTLVPDITLDTITTPPENFVTIVIQPTTGKAKLHRP